MDGASDHDILDANIPRYPDVPFCTSVMSCFRAEPGREISLWPVLAAVADAAAKRKGSVRRADLADFSVAVRCKRALGGRHKFVPSESPLSSAAPAEARESKGKNAPEQQ